jgi:hypothetical protein
MGMGVAIGTSIATTLSGLLIVSMTGGSEVRPFGWLLFGIGAVSLAANLLLARRQG